MRKACLLLLALLLSFPAVAQLEKKLPLKSILDQITARHRVTFNYIEDEIVLYELVPPKPDLPLARKLDYIQSQTRLQFKPVGSSAYAVTNDKNLDKPLCGFLRDKNTLLPIEAASLFIGGSAVSAVSDSKGYFELPVVSPNIIRISHQNYEPFNIAPTELYKPDCVEILLTPFVNTLEEVVAQRFLTTGITKNSDGSFRITPRHFGILPGLSEPDVLQTMQELPGIHNEDETISNISVRGGTHDQNLFLWNGIRMFQTGHFFGLISAFNPVLPQTIAITINGTSAFFGESVSSVADISSHTPLVGDTRYVFGSDLISANFYANQRLSPKASVAVSGRRSFGNTFNSPTYENYRDRIFQNTIVTNTQGQVPIESDEHFYFYDFTLQYRQKIGQKHELFFDGISMANSLIIDQTDGDTRRNNDLAQNSFGGVVDWTTVWNARHDSRINAYVSSYKLDSSTEEINTSSLTLAQQNKVLALGLRISHRWKFSDAMVFNAGYQFDETGVTNLDEISSPAFSRNVTEIMRTHVAVADALFKSPNGKSMLRTGLRVNYFDKFATVLPEVRIQFGYALSDALRVEILGEQKSQTLSQVIDRQADFLGIEKRRWAMSDNDAIPIQKGSQLSAGVTFKKNNWLITLDNFYKEVTGITTATQGFQNQLEFVRSKGSYRVLGSELFVQKNFGRVYAWLSYGFNDNRYRFKDLTPSYFANNFELRHTLSVATIYEWKKLKLALGGKWHSGRPVTTPASDVLDTSGTNPQIVYNNPNNDRLPDFFVLNFSASREWTLGKRGLLQISTSAINLLNTRNTVNRFYRVNDDAQTIDRIDTYALSRTPNLNVRVIF
jgi:hypothetical protein